MERTIPHALNPDETQKVLRRAAELDREHAPFAQALAPAETPGIEAAELERIAADSGLSPEAVRRALTELSGGALAPRAERKPAAAVAQRTFEERPEVIEERLTAAMLRGGLSPIYTAPHATQWKPAAGLGHSFSRAIDLEGKGAWLGATVESSVYGVAGQRSSAELRGEVRDMSLPIASVTGLLLAFPAGIALLVVLAIGLSAGLAPQHALALLLVVAAWAALTFVISRGVARRRVRKLQRALERMLSQIGG